MNQFDLLNIFIGTAITYALALNAFDISKKSVTAWCEDCNLVFDNRWTANSHKKNEHHSVRVSEFWITGKR